MVNILHATPKTNPWPLKNIAAIDNSSLNFRAQQKCLRSKLRPRHSGVRGFFVPLSPPEMNCLENDETDQCAATQSGCHGPALPAPPLFWFDIRRNMPHTDSLTFDVMSSRHTFQESQARSIRPLSLPPHLRSAVRSLVSGLINFLASFPRCAAASLCPAQRLSCTVTSPSNTAAAFSGVERNDN